MLQLMFGKNYMVKNSKMSKRSMNDSEDVEYLCEEIVHIETISAALFILVFIFSVAGNTLLLCVLAVYENLKNVTNLFVLNLACSDLVFAITLPFWAYFYLHKDWVFGDFCCKFMTAAYFVGLYSSVILLTAMTVDRFITVVLHNYWPSNCVRRQRCAVGACVAAWVISTAASLIDAIKVETRTYWNNLTECSPSSDGLDVNVGHYVQVSLLFFLPFVIIVFCYSAILKTVLQPSNRKRHRTVVVVLCVVATFFICWGPYNILLIVETIFKPSACNDKERLNIAFHICQILAFSHCCMNPVLYMLSQKWQKHLLHLLPCDKVCRKNRERGIGLSTSVIQNTISVAQKSTVVLELHSK
ncbi:chemokine XC receptor 1-like [Toxotes jaculatrix]|uniref:chemokine XC receptor 1-like n=1 Tax=Toxotes jaculatrix TaxID=941984 RepID=UPI001B3AF4CA|nr:chemokine XC receptor 1-like [Toxotes jaculatrix]